ncbi:hypothetical protein COX04_01675 [Candidatus Woesebacteria bacterium CG22_combo_CG10-13_8_21_14_all_45_10]|uniref:DUF1648 domain-containing protein n=1 Tax=Candidatus Woesebacteria bacterium CG22_combo_CG10-13_8_21_14_all_45_10 TaxID=1975060 RepID=A0A2H0BHA9_9BACT|nr:MAG: hypothetical protein COX04_01675 [Candidatus Woesebacteria bacterium CG22_combo_CG10-13_8_21_14_all_45_10]
MDKVPLKNYILAGGAIDLLTAIFVLFAQGRLPPQVPLFYGLPLGEDQLTKPVLLLIPAILSGLIILFNLLLARLTKDDFLKKAFAVAGLASAVFAGITTLKIIFLVGNF